MKNNRRGISALHLAMMALGTVIGGSFFLGSTVAVQAAGPGVVISYILGGALVYIILFALSELTVADAAPGSFRTFAERAYGPGVGFIVGWVYWTGIVLAMSSEALALSVFLQEWVDLPLPLMGSVIIVIVTLLNLLGADKLSRMESGLAFVKLFAIVGFVVLGLMIIFGLTPGPQRAGIGALRQEALFPGGIGGIAGSMLIVMFSYAGFEIIGLAASEAGEPHRTVPRAISYTVISLVSLYILTIVVLLLLIPVDSLSGDQSPLVLALKAWNIGWAGGAMNVVLITAVFSTMLASMFGLGRMMRSLADEGHAPAWLKSEANIPRKGILFSGAAMLAGLLFGFILPKQGYLFLVSSGGFSLLFTYVVILLTHYRFRKRNGCPPTGSCQLKGFPATSIAAIAVLIAVIVCMPLVPGQGYGLIAGIALVLMYIGVYLIKKRLTVKK
jgi:L-asparagine transporter-like permease